MRIAIIAATAAVFLFHAAPAPAQKLDAVKQAYEHCIEPDLTRMEEVIKSCTLVIKSGRASDRSQAGALLGRGNMYRRQGQFDRALTDYNESLRLDPRAAPTYTSRGNAWRGKKQYDRALADHSEAIRLDPKYATAYGNRGNVWLDKADIDRAISDYDQAISLNPQYGTAFFNRGLAREKQGDKARAIADYRQSLKFDANFRPAIDALKKFGETP